MNIFVAGLTYLVLVQHPVSFTNNETASAALASLYALAIALLKLRAFVLLSKIKPRQIISITY